MLKFFRTIRKKLIEEDNVRKYLLYAIGEILLVVIGILIALQVNNWNEQRLEIKSQKILLEEVIEALHADSLALEEMAALKDSTFGVYTQLYHISEGSLSPDSLTDTDLMRNSVIQLPVSKANYPDLASNVLDNDLKNKVLEYYQTLSLWEYIIEEYNRFIEDKMRPFLGEKEFLIYGYHHTGQIGRQGKIDKQKLIERLNQPEVRQMLFEATQKTRNYSDAYNTILREREDLIKEIKRVLE